MTHTEGPWKLSDDEVIGGWNNDTIAIIRNCVQWNVDDHVDRTQANARLIAAAPELLGALEGAINVIEAILLPGQKWLGMDEATEAIRKAKEA